MDSSHLQATVKKIKKGDRKAFKELFEYFHQGLFNYLLYKSGDSDLSEDLLQETFLKLWENRKQLDENQSVKSYLYTIANNLFLNHHRHLKIVDKHKSEYPGSMFVYSQHPHYLLEEGEFKSMLMSAINKLPDRMKEVFLMSRVESLSNREISERLGISLKTVEAHLGKALNQLSESIPRHYFKKNK